MQVVRERMNNMSVHKVPSQALRLLLLAMSDPFYAGQEAQICCRPLQSACTYTCALYAESLTLCRFCMCCLPQTLQESHCRGRLVLCPLGECLCCAACGDR